MTVVGSALQLWRFPLKSMQGEQLAAAHTTEQGFVGDRLYALLDTATNKVVSAKNPRKWPHLLDCVATFALSPSAASAPPPVRVVFHDGCSCCSDETGFEAHASAVLGRAVALRSVPPPSPTLEEYWPDIDGLEHRETVTDETISLGAPSATFFDYAPIHLVTTSTLASLQRAHRDGFFDPRRFRANILVETAGDAFPENDWVGRQVGVGDEVVLQVQLPCARCVMTTLPQRELPPDTGILGSAARENSLPFAPSGQRKPSIGVYAKVIRGGTIRPGDAVRV